MVSNSAAKNLEEEQVGGLSDLSALLLGKIGKQQRDSEAQDRGTFFRN